jgi:hypothetical protein
VLPHEATMLGRGHRIGSAADDQDRQLDRTELLAEMTPRTAAQLPA